MFALQLSKIMMLLAGYYFGFKSYTLAQTKQTYQKIFINWFITRTIDIID